MLDRLNNPTLDLSQIEHSDNPARHCRKLIAAGHDPATRLEAYRGDVLCLRVRSIGEAARLEISGKGCGFKRRPAVGTASLIALRGLDQ